MIKLKVKYTVREKSFKNFEFNFFNSVFLKKLKRLIMIDNINHIKILICKAWTVISSKNDLIYSIIF